MMRFLRTVGLAWLLALVAFAVLATGAFYPYHRIAAIAIYAVSWIPFCIGMRHRRQWLRKHADRAKGFLRDYKGTLAFALLALVFAYVLAVLVPLEPSVIADLTEAELSRQMDQDAETVLYLDDLLDDAQRALELRAAAVPEATFSPDERTELRRSWQRFVEASFELDLVKQRYQTFAQVNGFVRPVPHAEAFLLAYGAFVAQYTRALALQAVVGDNAALATLLNEENADLGIPADTYHRLKQLVTNPNEILRLNAGRAYLELMRGRLGSGRKLLERVDAFLAKIDGSLGQYPELLVDNPLEQAEKIAFDTWFPLQKNVALNLSYIRTATRGYLISPELVAASREKLRPGDILLERREWHATNVGIPGYWTHAAIFLGTLEQLEAEFSDVAAGDDGAAVAEQVRRRSPEALAALQSRDGRGFRHCVIEAKRPGVILTSLEDSAGADSLAVLRPKISDSDRWRAVLRAVAYLGRPYDYNFDFRTDGALVCSELVYKAYEEVEGLTFTLEEVNGRPVLPPNLIAKKYDDEFDSESRQLDLVLFLDGNEVEGTAVERGEASFRTSWRRPKWHILKDYAPSF